MKEQIGPVAAAELPVGTWVTGDGAVCAPYPDKSAEWVVSAGANGTSGKYFISRTSHRRKVNRVQRGPRRDPPHKHREQCPMRQAARVSNDEIELDEGYERYCQCKSCERVAGQHADSVLDRADATASEAHPDLPSVETAIKLLAAKYKSKAYNPK